MTEDDKRRIEEAAKSQDIGMPDKLLSKIFIEGAQYENPIAYNKALKDVLPLITRLIDSGADLKEIRHEIQKLKKP